MNLTVIDSVIKDAATNPDQAILIVSANHQQRRNTFSEFLDRLENVQDPNPFDDVILAVIPPRLIRFVNDSVIRFDTRGQGLPLGAGMKLSSFVAEENVVLTTEERAQLLPRLR